MTSLRNSPYAFEKVEFGADFKEMSKQRDGAETINNNLDFIALESYAHVKKANNAGTSCLLYTSPSPRDYAASRMPSSA